MNFTRILFEQSEKNAYKPALVSKVESISYARLMQHVARFFNALRADFTIGDHIFTNVCVRAEGVNPCYVDQNFKTKSNAALTQA